MANLGGGILKGDTIRPEVEVRLATNNLLVVGIIKVTIDDLLSQSEGLVQPPPHLHSQKRETRDERQKRRKRDEREREREKEVRNPKGISYCNREKKKGLTTRSFSSRVL